jgi:hypothetical protein
LRFTGRSAKAKSRPKGSILGKKPTAKDKGQIEKAVKKAVKDYGEVLRKLGEE